MRHTTLLRCFTAILLLCFSATCGKVGHDRDQVKAPAISIQRLTLEGGKSTGAEKAAHYRVLFFWTTWCGFCKKCFPLLDELQQKYAQKDIEIIAISDETEDVLRKFFAKRDKVPVFSVAVDNESKTTTAFGVTAIPATFVIDKEQNIIWTGRPQEGLSGVLEQITAGTFQPERAYRQNAAQNLVTVYKYLATETREKDLMKAVGDRAFEYADANPEALSKLARYIAANFRPPMQDLDFALKAVRKAFDLTGSHNSDILDTYARVMYVRGDIGQAVKLATQAVAYADNETRPDYVERLQKYERAPQGLIKTDA